MVLQHLCFFFGEKTDSNKFAKASQKGHKEMDFIESFFIGLSLEKNEKVLNVKKTKLLRRMKIPGFINPNKLTRGQVLIS